MDLSERTLIEYIREKAAVSSGDLIRGIGDDCSVFADSKSGSWLISTDMLVDGVHFNSKWHPARLLGRKSIAVNLSDIAAMGGIPRYVLIAMSLTAGLSTSWVFQWLDGVFEILREYDCALIGGDTVSAKEMTISVTILGERHPSGILFRNGAAVGDTVYVSSPLGSSAAGLAIMEKISKNNTMDDSRWEPLVQAHLNPVPRVHLGQLLCASGCVSAMQDISDGLATDLGHICKESGVGAVIQERLLPSHPILDEACSVFCLSKPDCMLCGGEDYQLVFTVKKGCEKKLEEYLDAAGGHPVFAVGTIGQGQGVSLIEDKGTSRDITFKGYEHRI